eukprot:7572101-Pyramimonas_sp.AAC.1
MRYPPPTHDDAACKVGDPFGPLCPPWRVVAPLKWGACPSADGLNGAGPFGDALTRLVWAPLGAPIWYILGTRCGDRLGLSDDPAIASGLSSRASPNGIQWCNRIIEFQWRARLAYFQGCIATPVRRA